MRWIKLYVCNNKFKFYSKEKRSPFNVNNYLVWKTWNVRVFFVFCVSSIINCDFKKSVIVPMNILLRDEIKIQRYFYHLYGKGKGLIWVLTNKLIRLINDKIIEKNENFSEFCKILKSLASLPFHEVDEGKFI